MILKVTETQATTFFEISDEKLIAELQLNRGDRAYIKLLIDKNRDNLKRVECSNYDFDVNISNAKDKMLKALGAIK